MPARIIGIADAYDAMTADRPYHKGISEAAALVEIQKGAGTQFDPLLAEVFVQAISKRTNAGQLVKAGIKAGGRNSGWWKSESG